MMLRSPKSLELLAASAFLAIAIAGHVSQAHAGAGAWAIVTTRGIDQHVGMSLDTSVPPGFDDRVLFFLDKPRSSPNGMTWAVRGFAELDAGGTGGLLMVFGPQDGQTVVVENETSFSDGSGEVATAMNSKYGLNDDGCYAVQVDGDTSGNDIVAKGCDGGALEVIARQGQAVPNLGGPTYIGFAREPQIDNTGKVRFGFDTSEDATMNRSVFVASSSTDAVRLFQEGVTVFAGQAGGENRTLEGLDLEFTAQGGLQVSGDGTRTMFRGDLTGATTDDDFVALDGTILVQESSIVNPAFTSPTAANSPASSILASNGMVYSRGTNADGQGWVVRNDELLAKTGDEVVPGTGETYQSFTSVAPGLDGDYAIGATTSPNGRGAIVYNDGSTSRVLCRTGDPVDLDGDDTITASDAMVASFGTDTAIIVADDRLLVTTSICVAPCATSPDFLGSAVVEIPLIERPPVDVDLDFEKTDALVADGGRDGISGGDVIEYTVTITNDGDPIENAVFTDLPDTNTLLESGSPTTTTGTITEGALIGESRVRVEIGPIDSDETVTITFQVRINLTIDKETFANQGRLDFVAGGRERSIFTDDPDTPEAGDPTIADSRRAGGNAGPGSDGKPGRRRGGGGPPDPAFCKGQPVTIRGTDGDDVIVGTSDDDVIHGFLGNDDIDGGGGNDLICGGAGNDLLKGGTGDDTICGNRGDDEIDGGADNDTIDGGAGADIGFGGTGDDVLDGRAGADVLSGQDGADVILGRAGRDTLDGGMGSDVLDGGSGSDLLLGGDGADLLLGGNGDDVLYGHDGDDLFVGGADDDELSGGFGDDDMFGAKGDDILVGELGTDFMGGGFGNDKLAGGPDAGDDPSLDRDEVAGGPGNDDVRGGVGDDKLDGGQGDDDLDGGDGADDCDGGLGDQDTAAGCETIDGVP